jgi:hypothetical protein
VTAGQRVREPRTRRSAPLQIPLARSPVPGVFLWSRAAIWAGALFALFVFEPYRNPLAARWDDPTVTRDLGRFTDIWARWDSVWFLRLAEHGYQGARDTAFLPLYPAVVGGLGRVFAGHYVLAGVLVSLAASLGSFVLLYRLAEVRLGADGARRAVLYLALFPMAFFLQAVYSESLYLLLVLAAFLLAERGRWPAAGAVAGLALLTRTTGLALLVALAVLAWRSPDRRRAFGGLAIAPACFAVYPLYLWHRFGDALAFEHAQDEWHRHLSRLGPIGGVWQGLRGGWAAVEQLVSGSQTHRYWPEVKDMPPLRVAAINLESLVFLIAFLALTVVVWRRFGAPYGLFCAVSLALPLSDPSARWPLLSIPRFGLVLFPLFLALASIAGNRPRAHAAILGVSSLLLGISIVQWTLWQWVA